MPPRPTLADVARAAGVSIATASLVLSGRPSRISEPTAVRVRAAADEVGWVADHSARALRTGSTATIGFLSDEVTVTRFASAMVRGVLDAADELGVSVLMMETGHDGGRLARALESFRSRGIEGLVVGLMDSRHIDLPGPPFAPTVLVNGTAEGLASILPDELVAGREAVLELARCGHRRIGAVGLHPTRPLPQVSVNIGVRMDGIAQGLAEAGLDLAAEHRGTVWEPPLGYEGAHAVLDQAPDITALLAVNDRVAFGIYQALAERGLRVPDDISVISFDDEELAAMVRPGLTSWRLPYRAMGNLAVRRLVGPGPYPGDTTLLEMPLVERASIRDL